MTAVMEQLAFDFEIDTPTWVPLYGLERTCRDCGSRTSFNQGGGVPGLGGFVVCDRCAAIDRCRELNCTPVAERREAASHFTVEEIAHCDCGWFVLDAATWDDSFSADDLLDLLAQHAQPRHVTRWGESHLVGEHDGLITAQGTRRAKYFSGVVTSAEAEADE